MPKKTNKKRYFKKYIFYSEEEAEEIKRQWYVSQKMKKKGIENTGVETLLNFIVSDIDNQYIMKQNIENKAGFLIALLGVMTTILLQPDFIEILLPNLCETYVVRIFEIVLLFGLTYLFCVSLLKFIEIFEKSNFSRVCFEDKERFFKCAVDDKELCLTLLLDCFTNVWIENEEQLMLKSELLKRCAKSVFAFTSLILTTYYITLFLEVGI